MNSKDKAAELDALRDDAEGMSYLSNLPRRIVVIYLPLAIFVFVLLFPFYWMAITAVKPNSQLTDYENYSPFWVVGATLEHIKYLLFRNLLSGLAVEHHSGFGGLDFSLAVCFGVCRLCHRAGAFHRGADHGPPDLPRLSGAASILFIPLAFIVFNIGIYDSRFALIFTYPTFLIPFCTWLLMGYFRSIPYELEESALVDGATRWQILRRIILPLAVPGLISAGIFAFTLSWNEFIYALTFIQSSENKTLPVGVLTELVRGDIFEWGALMAGALFGSLPVVILYSFFVDYYVSSMTGAVKE